MRSLCRHAWDSLSQELYIREFCPCAIGACAAAGLPLRWMLDRALPNWEEEFDWALLLERQSFFVLCASASALLFFALLRIFFGLVCRPPINVPRFRLRSQFLRAGMTFFRAPEIKVKRVRHLRNCFCRACFRSGNASSAMTAAMAAPGRTRRVFSLMKCALRAWRWACGALASIDLKTGHQTGFGMKRAMWQ